jgi:hypothetical protein
MTSIKLATYQAFRKNAQGGNTFFPFSSTTVTKKKIRRWTMEQDLREQACWLLLAYECGLSTRNINDVVMTSYLAEHGANIISGNARGVDRTAYEGATSTEGCTTVVLPHGMRKLSKVQWRVLLAKIESGKVLVLSQFHADAQWVVSRAMGRNKVVTGLAQIVIVAESNVEGGTWAGASGALRQNRPLYVREPASSSSLPQRNRANSHFSL